jgi:hypothetical protein
VLDDLRATSRGERIPNMEKHPSTRQAIRTWCIGCVGSAAQVRACGGDHILNGGSDERGRCLFYPFRMGRGRPSVKLIRRHCLWCQGGQAPLVRECHERECPLWPYRMGRNPNYAALSDLYRGRKVPKPAASPVENASNSHDLQEPHTKVRGQTRSA